MITEESKTSPMMAQWHACKQQAKDAVLLFRMGDFYEAFYDDAVLLSQELELTLTKRQGIPMAGVPCHTCESYIDKLVSKGFRVAIDEQMENPAQAKGLVKRGLSRIVTPGTTISSSLIPDKANNFFVSINQVGSLFGLAVLDLTTAEFRAAEFLNERDLLDEIHRIHPAEILIPEKFFAKNPALFTELNQTFHPLLSQLEDWKFDHQLAYNYLVNHFKVHSLDGFGLKGLVASINAAGALLAYLKDGLCQTIDHIQTLETYSSANFMTIDAMSLRNLELTESLRDGSRRNTLLNVVDVTKTAMGGRLMRQWVKQPLLSIESIISRQDAVESLLNTPKAIEKLSELLSSIRDLERLMMRVSTPHTSPRDLLGLSTSLDVLPALQNLLQYLNGALFKEMSGQITPLPQLVHLIRSAIVDEPPARLSDGAVFREGYHRELDELRAISLDSKTWMTNYQAQIREQTGIKTLKVGFNRMFGYYIEVSRGQADRMPGSFQRKQTLVNAERYITPELKDYEHKVLTAEERMAGIEAELFLALKQEVMKYSTPILRMAHHIANLDCLNSLAEVAKQNHYVRPTLDNSSQIHIVEGRHPVIETSNSTERFIPNDTILDDQQNRMLIITGPNMAGKSTYIRQVALIVIMAQMGSYVPAKQVQMGMVDKIFTRIGASDDLSRGQSTFMVEMTETAHILNHATSRSLVILDEIGRGTSTYDGISIAWAVAEYLLTAENKTAKTLFATHYWELTKLEEKHPGAVNYRVAVQECEDQIVFLRKIVRGGTDKSYGINVARLAGMPPWVISRAHEILVHLEENANRKSAFAPEKPKKLPPVKPKPSNYQLFLFDK